MDFSDLFQFIIKNQSFIISITTSVVLFSKLIAKRVFNIETRSDRKRTIRSDLEFARYLVDPHIKSHLVNQMAFEALTNQKASLETMKWLVECHDPSTALEIYAHAPRFINIQNNSIEKVKWIVKYGRFIYYVSLLISMIILIAISIFIFYSIDSLMKIN